MPVIADCLVLKMTWKLNLPWKKPGFDGVSYVTPFDVVGDFVYNFNEFGQIVITNLIGPGAVSPIDPQIPQHGSVVAHRSRDEMLDVLIDRETHPTLIVVTPPGVPNTGPEFTGVTG